MKQRPYHRTILIFLGISIWMAFLFQRCAHPVAPTGGPKDVTPPAVTEAEPPNFSTHFTEKKIQIEFDEFIQLKDQAKEVFVSPPMASKPELLVRGKSLIVQIKDELRPNMTYVINFGSAIVDITENNPLKGFSYVFSTGEVIDSLNLSGRIVNASDLKPAENVLFVIYSRGQDTIPDDSLFRKATPLSAVRTFADGTFLMTNLPGGEYLAYGLEDLNNNFYYDLPTEKIAFLDSLVTPEYMEVKKDTADTVMTNVPQVQTIIPKKPLTLYLFEEYDPLQKILSSSMTSAGSILFAFRRPIRDFEIRPLNFTDSSGWKIMEFNHAMDTLHLWPTDYERDTFELFVNVGDTLLDTLSFIRREDQKSGQGRRRELMDKKLEISLNTKAGVLAPGKELVMTFSEPLVTYDFSGILLYSPEDTIQPEVFISDSIGRKATVRNDWDYGEKYVLHIPDSVMTGLSGAPNDSIKNVVLTRSLEEYGSFIMNYRLPPGEGNYITELMNEKEAVIQRDTLITSETISYKYLSPGIYRIKMIIDRNGNGAWDTGILHKKLPERVLYFGKDISIRSNWELQEEWQPEL